MRQTPLVAMLSHFDQEILVVRAPTERWVKELMWIPGFLLLGLVAWLQRRRREHLPATAS